MNSNSIALTFLVFDTTESPAASAKSVSKILTDIGEMITFLFLLSLKIAYNLLHT